MLCHQIPKWRGKKLKLPFCFGSLEQSSRRGFITTQLQIMNVHLFKNYTLLICYLVFFIAGFLLCSIGERLQIWPLLRLRSRQGRCSYSEMHGVYQRRSLQTCILKPIHYQHNENPHPTPSGRPGAECEWRAFTLEAAEGMLGLPNYLITGLLTLLGKVL